jgi:hypothetical protein
LNRRELDVGAPWPILKYWFIQPPNGTAGLPVKWQGWLRLIGVFALEIVATRELQGVARAVAFCIVALGFLARPGKDKGRLPRPATISGQRHGRIVLTALPSRYQCVDYHHPTVLKAYDQGLLATWRRRTH